MRISLHKLNIFDRLDRSESLEGQCKCKHLCSSWIPQRYNEWGRSENEL